MNFSGPITRLLILAVLIVSVGALPGAEGIPKSPARHFNDYTNVISSDLASRLDNKLVAFERETSNQVVVAIYPKMESASSIEEYSAKVFNAWKIGTKEKNNGALLLIFLQNRTMYLRTGYGLESAIPNATAKHIIDDSIRPFFRKGDYESGVDAGVQAIVDAARGEYLGSGSTVYEDQRRRRKNSIGFAAIVACIFIFIYKLRSGTLLTGSGRGWRSRQRWGSSGGGGGFSGGGFSGGGGRCGGGGAGGSW